ncbi:MAG: FAD-dependent oxidoreductase [Chloroflexi bacterium]|nr:FAD-dependent oxidoreductase [Chloroflexota bacterium]
MAAIEHLVIGGGYAGATAAITLRKAGATGPVLLVAAEPEYPYMRYTLSKEFLQGKRQREKIFLRLPSFYQEQGIEIKLGTRAVGLDARKRTATLDTGQELAFQKLLLATGASPRRLPLPGADLPGVYYLRSLADAEQLRNEMAPGRRVAIIGGGFIGVELAASFTQAGLQVTIIDVVQTLWAHIVGEAMGRFFHDAIQKRGVTILAPAHVQRIEGIGRAQQVVTQEGQSIPCDFVVIGVGVRPETGLAEAAGLKVDNGILVNEYMESSEPGIFAAGDNARFHSRLFEAQMRIEHWDVAAQQGATAAWNMLGQNRPFEEVPYFFSGLFDIWLEYLGYAPEWDRLTIRRLGPERFTAFYSQGPHVKGALLVNNSKELQACRNLIKRKLPVDDPAALEDPGLELANYVAR